MIRFSLNFSLPITANTLSTLLVPGLMATLIHVHEKLYCMIACLLAYSWMPKLPHPTTDIFAKF